MGTRYEDQPAEHWAGPESLDPTPVWKQYVLIAALLVVGLVVVVAGALASLAPQLVTPPAVVFGERLVLSSSDVPAVGAAPRFVGAPVVDASRSFFLVQPSRGEVLALRSRWRATPRDRECPVVFTGPTFRLDCPGSDALFTTGGEPATNEEVSRACGPLECAYRGLDQYLVSVSGDRVIVNLSRLIEAAARTTGPVPTGIPQPQRTP